MQDDVQCPALATPTRGGRAGGATWPVDHREQTAAAVHPSASDVEGVMGAKKKDESAAALFSTKKNPRCG
jgi:hypothetical protein